MSRSRVRSRIHRRAHGSRFAALSLPGALSFVACSGNDTGVYKLDDDAGLVLRLTSDMSIPKDIDSVEIRASSNGSSYFSKRYVLGQAGLRLPATLRFVPLEEASARVTLDVTSFQNGEPRTLRRVVTTIPTTRQKLLEVPLQWLCAGQVEAESEGKYTSSCETGESCVAGECVSDEVSSSALPDHSRSTAESCFDTVACFTDGVTLTDQDVDLESCTLELQALSALGDSTQLNFALSLPPLGDGICDEGTACYLPLDFDPNAEREFGWATRGASSLLELPPAACAKLADGTATLIASASCPTKTLDTPTCGPWASEAGGTTIPPGTIGGPSSGSGSIPPGQIEL